MRPITFLPASRPQVAAGKSWEQRVKFIVRRGRSKDALNRNCHRVSFRRLRISDPAHVASPKTHQTATDAGSGTAVHDGA